MSKFFPSIPVKIKNIATKNGHHDLRMMPICISSFYDMKPNIYPQNSKPRLRKK